MKRNFIFCLLTGSIAVFSLTACNNERIEESVLPQSQKENAKINLFGEKEMLCAYVDGGMGGPDAFLTPTIGTWEDTNFMNSQMARMARMWGRSTPILQFVNSPSNYYSTNNAFSFPSGKIYYGYAMYYNAKAKGGNIVNAMILAHEYGHQLQFAYNLPSQREFTVRSMELEADGFAGSYLRSPNGYNITNFYDIASAAEFAASIGDYGTTNPDHHGTPPQRRSAVRLGYFLGQFNFSAWEFDRYFFYYYQAILNGALKNGETPPSPEIDSYMSGHMDELRKIYSGEISAEEFKKLN